MSGEMLGWLKVSPALRILVLKLDKKWSLMLWIVHLQYALLAPASCSGNRYWYKDWSTVSCGEEDVQRKGRLLRCSYQPSLLALHWDMISLMIIVMVMFLLHSLLTFGLCTSHRYSWVIAVKGEDMWRVKMKVVEAMFGRLPFFFWVCLMLTYLARSFHTVRRYECFDIILSEKSTDLPQSEIRGVYVKNKWLIR